MWDVGSTLYDMQDDPLRALGGFVLGRGMNFAARGVANAVQSHSANKSVTSDVSGGSRTAAFDASSSSRTKPSDLDAGLPKNKAGDSASATSSRTSKSNSKNSDLSNNSVESRVGTDKAPSSAGRSQSSSSSSSRSGSDVWHVDTSKADTARPRTGDSGKPSSGSRGNDVSHVDTGKADLPNKTTPHVSNSATAASMGPVGSGLNPVDMEVPKVKPGVDDPKLRPSAGTSKKKAEMVVVKISWERF